MTLFVVLIAGLSIAACYASRIDYGKHTPEDDE